METNITRRDVLVGSAATMAVLALPVMVSKPT